MSALLTSLAALLSLTQAEVPPTPELIDRFIAAVPEGRQPLEEVDFDEFDRLVQLNPGREGKIRAILQAHALCTAPARRASIERMLRQTATALGTANVEAMIRFYQGPDMTRFGALAVNTDKNAEENAEFERLLSTYPVEAFEEAIQTAGMEAFIDEGFFSAMEACDRPKAEALARANLRSED
jgi:hypothetical protein